MLEGLAPAIESHLMRAVLISGVVALALTAGVALVWWRGRRWTRARSSSTGPLPHLAAFSRAAGTPGSSGEGEPSEADRRTGDDQLASRLVRDAAARAAALRETWDRSYREAREPGADAGVSANAELSVVLQDLLREQRETNALLRELVSRLSLPPD